MTGSISRFSPLAWLAAIVAVAALLVSPAGAALAPPIVTGPADGSVVDALPAFGWHPADGAARYEWEISASPDFNAPVLGLSHDHFFTRNTRATMTKSVPNGTYWWHVRSVSSSGAVSPWSGTHSFTKNWAASPSLLAPADSTTIVYPRDPFRLAWTPVPGAARYLVSVATDPTLGSLVWTTPVQTQATTFTLASPLVPDKTYYWGITPVDAGGNQGSASEVWSFTWAWPSQTTPVVTDMASAVEIYDHRFSWDPVPGAAGYEVEINSSSDFAGGSWVCCAVHGTTKVTTIGTSYSPTVVLQNNSSYYWRVRALDASRNAGEWNEGPPFAQAFDTVVPSVTGLRMLDNPFPADPAFETDTPIVAWNQVPGASSYEVEVTPFVAGCQWSWSATPEHWKSRTATTSWTPLGSGWNGVKPFSSSEPVSTDTARLVAGRSYCVRVTAIDRPANTTKDVRSRETYLPNENAPAFTWVGPPAGETCSPSCNAGALGSADYLTPLRGEVQRRMPLFRWNPLEGAQSYFVLVAKDPHFSNLVDYAFTRLPAYAPRKGFATRTYPDETTLYYWAVLPATEGNGAGVTTAPEFSAPADFHKQSLPPALLAPAEGTVFPDEVTFHWAPAEGARRYRLQVAQDSKFSSQVKENVLTDSTAYTSSATYPADSQWFWRVRAEDENGIALSWSAPGKFGKTLAQPVLDPGNPTGGDALPTWQWAPVPGAVSYDLQVAHPDGRTTTNINNVPAAAFTPTLMKGTGIWKWRVRANFPQVASTAATDGPWTAWSSFTRTIKEPANPREEVTPDRVLLAWNPKLGAFNYRVQVSTRPDFATIVQTTTTDHTTYAPLLTQFQYSVGGTFYWRVAAADDLVLNVGDFTVPRSFVLPAAGTSSKMASSITATVTKTSAKVKVGGRVTPSHAGQRVVVTLYRKKGGVFVKLAAKRPTLTAASSYTTAFKRPRAGRCKVQARFPGDADHLASARTVKFRC